MHTIVVYTRCGLRLLCVAILLTTTPPALGQSVTDSVETDTVDVRSDLEPLLDSFTDREETSDRLSERYAELLDTPLDLNRVSASDLSIVPGLSVAQAHAIVQHRERDGPYQDLKSLTAVERVSVSLVRSIRPFITVTQESETPDDPAFPSLETIRSELEVDVIQRVSRRLDLARGYRTNRFLGSPERSTTRFHLQHGRRLQLGLTLDKDPGEPLRWSPSKHTYAFDHVSASMAIRNVGPLEKLVLGDFTTQFGQGVGLWQGIRFGKGRDPIGPVVKRGRGLIPYNSASETNFFRGAGATMKLPLNLHLTAFGSRRHHDATLDSSQVAGATPTTPIPIRTVSSGGRHRTASEVARKGTFQETLLGAAMEYRKGSLYGGIAAYRSTFDRPVRPRDKPYRRFRVSGWQTSMVSTYLTAFLDEYVLFGEVARSPAGTYGGLAGATVSANEIAKAVLLARHYPAEFPNFHGNAFGESGGASNESGVYTGIQLQVAEDWSIRAYVDQYKFPWLRFSVGQPSSGWEARTVLTYEPRPWLNSYVQFRVQSEESGVDVQNSGSHVVDGLQKERRHSVRLHTEYAFSDILTLRTRVEATRHENPAESHVGTYLSQGLRYQPTSSLQFDARIAFFDTDGYKTRIYSYEHDLLYSFSVPVFFDRGRRSYVLLEYSPTSTVTVEAKYGTTRYDNRARIGSGLNQIDGPRRRKIALQLRWDF